MYEVLPGSTTEDDLFSDFDVHVLIIYSHDSCFFKEDLCLQKEAI